MTRRNRPAGRALREREFHRWLARALPAGHAGPLPIGDDAAAIPPPRGHVAVVSTDLLVEGTHFLPGSPPARVGAAAAAVSLSDVAAKGARPAAILIGLILPVGTRSEWPEAVVRGAERLGARFGAHIVGGDTKPGPVRAIASTVLGWGSARALVPRSGARAGDWLAVTGVVGRGGMAAANLAAGGVRRRRAASELVDVRPRVREGVALAPFAHAMLDTSDGLADSARLLAAASRVRVRIDEARLPLARGVAAGRSADARRAIAFFGGDYELLVALPPARWRRAERAVRRVGGALTRIGRVERGRGAWLETGDALLPMPRAGWQPFERSRGSPSVRLTPDPASNRGRARATLK